MRYGAVLHVKDRQIAILDSFFEKHGPKTVFFGRWVIFLRVWAALFAGASRMHWRQFFFWNALGGLAWATTMASLAYVFAASVARISKVFGVLAWVFAIAVGIAVAIFINRMQKRAENRAQVDAAEERIRRGARRVRGAPGGAQGAAAVVAGSSLARAAVRRAAPGTLRRPSAAPVSAAPPAARARRARRAPAAQRALRPASTASGTGRPPLACPRRTSGLVCP